MNMETTLFSRTRRRDYQGRTLEDGAFLDAKLANACGKADEGEADDVREEGHDGSDEGRNVTE